jgi:acyl-CoA synthetase (AMP-forming)/AMP-acid ligase II/acyl carrier protein
MTARPQSLYALLAARAAQDPDAPAIMAVSGAALSYGELLALIDETGAALNRRGLGRGDAVALVAGNGPVMATAFLAIASSAVCAPLNPAYTQDEFSFYLGDLQAKALILEAGGPPAAARAAQALDIPVITLRPRGGQEGRFQLEGAAAGAARRGGPAPGEDIALVLHTSGTTSRPKIVPIRQASLTTSAGTIARTLALAPAERALNIMPLFHIHGLAGVLLSSLHAGGAVICTPGFDAAAFGGWLADLSPDWWSAVPTMHQAILRLCEADPALARGARPRFIRSSSSALPPSVMAGLEAAFGCPVIEAYGMTEAAHQIASNPLPPGVRKAGTVGPAAGPQVAIMAEDGALLPAGETGEIVLKGAQIITGYANNPEANAAGFRDGWFRTGDQGRIDADGYITITGRLKEIINRGGEKIAPREIDEALLAHPAVAQAVAFAAPHPSLGEEPAAAVVLRPGETVSPAALARHLEGRLARFKLPRRILFVDEIPKGPTGKIQRIGLARRLGLTEAGGREHVAPRGATQKRLAALWAEVLGLQTVSAEDEFLDLGGDSLSATQLLLRISEVFGVALGVDDVLDTPTVAAMAALIDRREPQEISLSPIAPRQSAGAPTSHTQEWFWRMEQVRPGNAAWNRPSSLRLTGPLDVPALAAAFGDVVARHEALRLRLTDDGRRQSFVEPGPLDLPVVDLSVRADPEATAQARARSWEQTPIDLGAGPPFHAELLKLGPEHHILCFTVHHIAFDGWSSGVLMGDLDACYAARIGSSDAPAPLTVNYGDYAAWQRRQGEAGAFDEALDYWAEALGRPLPPVWPVPDITPHNPRRYEAASRHRTMDPAIWPALRDLARDEACTPFMVFLAGFWALAHRDHGRPGVRVATQIAGRNAPHLDELIGLFSDSLALVGEFEKNTNFRRALRQARRCMMRALAHRAAPYPLVLDRLGLPAAAQSVPLTPVILQFRNFPVPMLHGPLAMAEALGEHSLGRFDLSLYLWREGDALLAEAAYALDAYSDALMERLLADYDALLLAALAAPDTPLLSL